jgi:hypothetical protein
VFQVAATVNGVQYSPTAAIATPIASSSGSGTTSTPLNSGAFDHVISARGLAAWTSIVTGVVVGIVTTL